MADRREKHLSEEQLSRFQDGELPAAEASHLEWCAECNRRLRDLQDTVAAWREYRADLPVPAPPRPWRNILALHEDAERRRERRWFCWQIPAVAAALLLVVFTVITLR